MTDESGQTYPCTIDALLDKRRWAPRATTARSPRTCTPTQRPRLRRSIVASAQARGVPVVSARQLLTWLDGRNSSSFESLTWSGNSLVLRYCRRRRRERPAGDGARPWPPAAR